MDCPVTTRAALLLALREGPGYGLALIRRVSRVTGGRVHPPEGSVYPALKELERDRLVRAWTVVPGRRRGARGRRYYELTLVGIRAAEAQGEVLAGLLGLRGPRVARTGDPAAGMLGRVRLGGELSDLAERLGGRVGSPRVGRTS